jgi:hypothetical protein
MKDDPAIRLRLQNSRAHLPARKQNGAKKLTQIRMKAELESVKRNLRLALHTQTVAAVVASFFKPQNIHFNVNDDGMVISYFYTFYFIFYF